MTTSFTKTHVRAICPVLLLVLVAACHPAGAVPPCASPPKTADSVAAVVNEPIPEPLPVPAPPPTMPQAKLAMRDATNRDLARDFNPVFSETERASRQRVGDPQDLSASTVTKFSAAREASTGDALTALQQDAASLQQRGALEALDRLAFSVPVLEDGRGTFFRLSVDDLFEPGEATFAMLATLNLDDIARALRKQKDRNILVQGYTDSLGSKEEARELSLRRAKAVCRYLIQRGVSPGRLKPQGFGAANPIAENSTPKGRSRNRRIEIVITPEQSG